VDRLEDLQLVPEEAEDRGMRFGIPDIIFRDTQNSLEWVQ
jgi:hypothetical protein